MKNKSFDFSQPLGIAFIHGFYSKMTLKLPYRMSFTIQDESRTLPIQFIKYNIFMWSAMPGKVCTKGHRISQKKQCSTFPLTENLSWAGGSANCRHYDTLSSRGEFIWEQTINWVQNFIVLHKSDQLYKAISLNNNKPGPVAKLLSLNIQKMYI